MTSDKIRLLICDDHPVVRKGLITLLSSDPDLEVIGEAVDGVDVVFKAQQLRPDVVLLDLVMPRQNGVEAITQIKTAMPDIRILVLTSFAEDDKIFPAISAGALDYLLKNSSPEQLLETIHAVYQGEALAHPNIALRLIRQLDQPNSLPLTSNPLTDREVDILKLVARGLSNHEIAEALVVSDRTVGNHLGNILDKLHLANRTQAALYALREGLASLDDN